MMRPFNIIGTILLLILLVGCAGSSNQASSISDGALEQRLSAYGLKKGDPVFIRTFKEERILELWMKNSQGTYVHFTNYPICHYSGSLGPKFYEGDKQTPEGFYSIFLTSLNPNSRFHKSFNIGYPNLLDRAHGRTGSYIMVHGECVSVGCYAMRNDQIDEIYALVEAALRNGQGRVELHAFPFKMTKSRMRAAKHSEHYSFWKDLEPAYRAFERKGRVPQVKIVGKRYVVQ